jgi:hypothetical protein
MKVFAASAAMIALSGIPHAATAQTGNSPFCLQTAAGARCVFATMAECEKARGSTSSGQCMTRADAHGTTGLGEPPLRSPGTPTEPSSSTGR